MIALYIDETGHLAQCRKDLQTSWVHFDESRAEREIGIELLKAIETLIENF